MRCCISFLYTNILLNRLVKESIKKMDVRRDDDVESVEELTSERVWSQPDDLGKSDSCEVTGHNETTFQSNHSLNSFIYIDMLKLVI